MTVSLSLDPQFFHLRADSHHRLVGTPLIDNGIAPADAARWLYEDAPVWLLAPPVRFNPVRGTLFLGRAL